MGRNHSAMNIVSMRRAAGAFAVALLTALAAPIARAEADEPTPAADVQSQIQSEQEHIMQLQQRLIPLLRRGADDQDAQAEAAAIEREIALHSQKLAQLIEMLASVEAALREEQAALAAQAGRQSENARALAEVVAAEAQKQIVHMQQTLAEREKQMSQMAARLEEAMHQLAELEDSRQLPPLEEAEIKVFALRNVSAVKAAEVIDALLGPGEARVAIDERSNALIVAGKGESLAMIEALLMRLDEQSRAEPEPDVEEAQHRDTQSLILRTFWLADGLPEGQGQEPDKFLPQSVLRAVEGLGLDEPRLVSQTVNSLSRDENPDREVNFTSRVPALVFATPSEYASTGRIWPVRDGRVEVEIDLGVSTGGMTIANLSGSLATPLGHFMVLGTANLVSPEMGAPPGIGGMGMEGGYDGGRGGYGVGGRAGGYGRSGFGEAGTIDAAAGMPIGPDGIQVDGAEPKFNTSHFAFVVQVLEAESFAEDD